MINKGLSPFFLTNAYLRNFHLFLNRNGNCSFCIIKIPKNASYSSYKILTVEISENFFLYKIEDF